METQAFIFRGRSSLVSKCLRTPQVASSPPPRLTLRVVHEVRPVLGALGQVRQVMGGLTPSGWKGGEGKGGGGWREQTRKKKAFLARCALCKPSIERL